VYIHMSPPPPRLNPKGGKKIFFPFGTNTRGGIPKTSFPPALIKKQIPKKFSQKVPL